MKLNSQKKKIRKIVLKTLKSNSNDRIKLEISKVKPEIAEIVKKTTGLHVNNFTHIIDNYAIKHTIAKHGNKTYEEKRGQIPITIDKFELIPEIISKPDKIIDLGKNKIGRRLFCYMKKINNELYYIEEKRTKRKELAMVTFYIVKKTKKAIKK